MYSLLGIVLFLAMGTVLLRAWQHERARRLALERIGLQTIGIDEAAPFAEDEIRIRPFPPRYFFAIPLVAIAAGAAILFGTNLPKPYAIGVAVLTGGLAYLFEVYWADKQVETIEAQLAEAIDLMVATLRAGSALLAAFEATLRESRQPMRGELENIVGRIRVGEDPRIVIRELALRVPLESFRLFCHTLVVHWETGGSLASSLRTVGKTVRDRLEVSRRIGAQAVESQISVIAIMIVTYALAFFTSKSNPIPFFKLIYSEIGSNIAAALMILQTVGAIWIWRMSRIRF